MIPRGFFVAFTGLLVLGGTTAALAQPEPAPVPPAPPVHVAAPAIAAARPAPRIEMPVQIEMLRPQIEMLPPLDMLTQIEIPTVESLDLESMMRQLERIDPVQIEEAVDKAHAAVEQLQFDKRFQFEGPVFSADQAHEIRVKVHDAMEYARGDIDAARELAETKALTLTGMNGLHVPRVGQARTAQIARMFERCESWRGSNKSDEVEDRYYDCGRRAVDESQWERAVDYFGRAAAAKGARADGALYWKAWAQNRLGQRTEALTTLSQLKGANAKSRWANDASALEVEIRQRSGQPVDPAATQDEELQLLALNAVRDSPSAVPMLEGVLKGPKSPKLKERALFVIAQNPSPAARAILAKVAKGEANPELQLKAVQYLGTFKSAETRDILSQAYKSSADVAVKRAILRSYMVAQDRERLLDAARSETEATLRLEAVRQLGNMRATTELVDLYGRESAPEVKKQILRSLANSGQTDRLAALAQTEQDPELKRTAIRALGLNRNAQTGTQLVDMYAKDQTRLVRDAVIDALFVQGNATALVSLARKEKDPELRRALVAKLANMRGNAEAEAYMLELLK